MNQSVAETVDADGYAIVEDVISAPAVAQALAAISTIELLNRAGKRNLLAVEQIARIARCSEVRGLVEPLLGPEAFAVDCVLFDKSAAANWKVAWHQDLTIPVSRYAAVDGYIGWSEKDGAVYVQPPADVLEQILIARVHLDDCRRDNGPLRVVPGSHRSGKCSAAAIREWHDRGPSTECVVGKGGVLLMRPLLIHASSPAAIASHRRVLHFQFTSRELHDPLDWNMRC